MENLLPAYEEDLLSPEEKKSMEGHIATCPRCSQDLEDLKKAHALVRDIEEVEPPPFFEGRIMARIRDEAGRKQGLLRRFFYPLYVKIPVQIMATILIAVLAFHVYRGGEPEIQKLTPPLVPLIEMEKGQDTAESRQRLADSPAILPAQRTGTTDLSEKKQQQFVTPPFEKGMAADGIANSRAATREERPWAMKPAAPEIISPAQKEKRVDTAAAVGESRKMRTEEERGVSAIDLTIQVADTSAAVREIEERLGRMGARIIEQKRSEGGEFLEAEIAATNVGPFLDGLEEVGRVRLKKSPLPLLQGKRIVSIKIVHNP